MSERTPEQEEIAQCWDVLEGHSFPPEACGWPLVSIIGQLPNAIDCAINCLVRQREDLLAELLPVRAGLWQIVPKEPTKEMIQACIWALDRWREKHGNVQGFVPPGDKYQVRWRAMLEAAPAPVAAGVRE